MTRTDYNRAYYLKNKERLREQNRVYRKTNLEKLREADRQRWAQKSPEEKQAILAYNRKRVNSKSDPKRLRKSYYIKSQYGITIEQWDAMFEAQGRCCAICRSSEHGGRGWCVDHCHVTNVVRGILCPTCNRAIGLLKDDVGVLRAALVYLEKPQSLTKECANGPSPSVS